jgi:hypothetical protein
MYLMLEVTFKMIKGKFREKIIINLVIVPS